MKYTLRRYQQEASDKAVLYMQEGERPFVLVLPTGCHAKGTDILMYDGSLKKVENIKVNDEIMGINNQKRIALQTIKGTELLYRVTPNKGNSFLVNENHILAFEKQSDKTSGLYVKPRYTDCVKVKNCLNKSKTWKHLRKLQYSSANFKSIDKKIILDPWVLGVLIGDGCLLHGTSFTNSDDNIIELMNKKVKKFGVKPTIRYKIKRKKSRNINYFYPKATRSIPNPLTSIIKQLGLYGKKSGDKFVPNIYKRGSRNTRLKILAGILDTEGHLCKNEFSYVSKSKQLAKDVQFICKSLGFRAIFSKKIKSCQTIKKGVYWGVHITGDLHLIPNICQRKKVLNKRKCKVNPLVTGWKIEKTKIDNYYGFELDGDNLYLTGDFMIHHNSGKSLVIAEICHQLNEPILILQPTKEILEQNYSKLVSYGIKDISIYSASLKQKEIGKYTYATIGSIFRKPELFKDFKYVLLDECHGLDPKKIKGMYNKFFKEIKPKAICGLTASPYRLTQKYFKEGKDLFYTSKLSMINRIYPFFFKQIIYKVDNEELLKKKYLCPIKYYKFNDFDTSHLKINSTGADYDKDAVEAFWSDSRLKKLSQIILDFDKRVKHNLIFCSSIRQADRAKAMLTTMGLSADVVTSKHNKKEREVLIANFRSGKIKHLLNVGILNCLSEDTEILSETGWVNINTIDYSKKIAQYNINTKEIIFKIPQKIIKKDLKLDEEMVKVDGRYVSISTTANHNFIASEYYNDNFRKIKAKELVNKKCNILVSGFAKPQKLFVEQEQIFKINKNKFIISNSYNYRKKGIDKKTAKKMALNFWEKKSKLKYKNPKELTLDECRFIGFWLGDGSVSTKGKSEKTYSLAQSKGYPKMLQWIENILKSCNVDYSYSDSWPTGIIMGRKCKMANEKRIYRLPKGTGGHTQSVNGIYRLLPYLNKKGTKWFWGLNRKQYFSLMEGLWQADGWHGNNKPYKGGAITKSLIDLFELLQKIGVCRGYRVTIKPVKMRPNNKKQLYRLSLYDKQKHQLTKDLPILYKNKSQNKRVWCVSTDLGTIITRKKGTITIMGNCGFDFPSLDGITLARPTLSLALFYQQIGRGIRIDPDDENKLCHVLDITDNVKKMGRIETIKIEKEADGFKDMVTTEKGKMTDVPLFKFKTKKKFKKKDTKNAN